MPPSRTVTKVASLLLPDRTPRDFCSWPPTDDIEEEAGDER